MRRSKKASKHADRNGGILTNNRAGWGGKWQMGAKERKKEKKKAQNFWFLLSRRMVQGPICEEDFSLLGKSERSEGVRS